MSYPWSGARPAGQWRSLRRVWMSGRPVGTRSGSRAAVAFDAVIGAPNRHAQLWRLLVPSEAMVADAETPAIDERADEQRQDDAVRAMPWALALAGRAGADAASQAFRVGVEGSEGAGCRGHAHCLAPGFVWN